MIYCPSCKSVYQMNFIQIMSSKFDLNSKKVDNRQQQLQKKCWHPYSGTQWCATVSALSLQ